MNAGDRPSNALDARKNGSSYWNQLKLSIILQGHRASRIGDPCQPFAGVRRTLFRLAHRGYVGRMWQAGADVLPGALIIHVIPAFPAE